MMCVQVPLWLFWNLEWIDSNATVVDLNLLE